MIGLLGIPLNNWNIFYKDYIVHPNITWDDLTDITYDTKTNSLSIVDEFDLRPALSIFEDATNKLHFIRIDSKTNDKGFTYDEKAYLDEIYGEKYVSNYDADNVKFEFKNIIKSYNSEFY